MTDFVRPESAISIKGVSKKYELYETPFDRLREALHPTGRKYHKPFFALSDINLEVKRGDSIAIIGKNGSGKSTLLKLICGVLSPSAGELKVNGTISALLELGAGFNPEFTGLENVFFNGSLMGYSRSQLEEKLDDILGFADIGEFINQPVKTYSSGMFVRLAFSVATSMSPDILIIDEALSVGDMFFLAKCMLRMKKMLDAAATVVFVSHDIGSLKSLCQYGILLEGGKIKAQGGIAEVAETYFHSVFAGSTGEAAGGEIREENSKTEPNDTFFETSFFNTPGEFDNTKNFMRVTNNKFEIINVELKRDDFRVSKVFDFNDTMVIDIFAKTNEDVPALGYGFHIRDQHGVDILYTDNSATDKQLRALPKGSLVKLRMTTQIPLAAGSYSVSIVFSRPIDIKISQVEFYDFIPIAAQFKVNIREPSPIYGKVSLPVQTEIQIGILNQD